MKKFLLFSIVVLAGFTGCVRKASKPVPYYMTNNTAVKPCKQEHALTVFVHGTVLVPKGVFTNFFYSKPGMHHASTYDTKYRLRHIADSLCASGFCSFDTFYLYGWNGVLSFQERAKAAAAFAESLASLAAAYEKKYGSAPYITVITHSHGGNVALNVAHYAKNICIDRLILLACPVQEETRKYITSSVFKKIYSFYSHLDSIQVLDPQGIQCKQAPLFSERCFEDVPNLVQVKTKINGRGIMHVEFLLDKFLYKLPLFMNKLEALDQECRHVAFYYTDSQSKKC